MAKLDANKAIALLREAAEKASGGDKRKAVLQAAADSVAATGAPYTSVYMYMLEPAVGELVLEAFCGRVTEHMRIKVGLGVCGSAVSQGQDINVGDVSNRSNYIACNAFTRSELVVLIRKDEAILGQIDVDSDELNPFTPDEEAALKCVADAIADMLN